MVEVFSDDLKKIRSALELTKNDAEKMGFKYGDQSNCVKALKLLDYYIKLKFKKRKIRKNFDHEKHVIDEIVKLHFGDKLSFKQIGEKLELTRNCIAGVIYRHKP